MAWFMTQYTTKCPQCGGLLVVEVEAFYNIRIEDYEHPWVYVEPCDKCEWEPHTREEFRSVIEQLPLDDPYFAGESLKNLVEKAYTWRWEPHRLRVVLPIY